MGLMRVQDRANVLTSQQEIDLARKSEALERATTDQLVVVTVPSLDGNDIAKFSTALGNQLRLGQAGKDNGILIVLAPQQRSVRIATGSGLEGLLTDERAAKIVQLMVPKFRTGDYASGVEVGVNEIDATLRSDKRRPQYRAEQKKAAA